MSAKNLRNSEKFRASRGAPVLAQRQSKEGSRRRKEVTAVVVCGGRQEKQGGERQDAEEDFVPRQVKLHKALAEHHQERGVGVAEDVLGGGRG